MKTDLRTNGARFKILEVFPSRAGVVLHPNIGLTNRIVHFKKDATDKDFTRFSIGSRWSNTGYVPFKTSYSAVWSLAKTGTFYVSAYYKAQGSGGNVDTVKLEIPRSKIGGRASATSYSHMFAAAVAYFPVCRVLVTNRSSVGAIEARHGETGAIVVIPPNTTTAVEWEAQTEAECYGDIQIRLHGDPPAGDSIGAVYDIWGILSVGDFSEWKTIKESDREIFFDSSSVSKGGYLLHASDGSIIFGKTNMPLYGGMFIPDPSMNKFDVVIDWSSVPYPIGEETREETVDPYPYSYYLKGAHKISFGEKLFEAPYDGSLTPSYPMSQETAEGIMTLSKRVNPSVDKGYTVGWAKDEKNGIGILKLIVKALPSTDEYGTGFAQDADLSGNTWTFRIGKKAEKVTFTATVSYEKDKKTVSKADVVTGDSFSMTVRVFLTTGKIKDILFVDLPK